MKDLAKHWNVCVAAVLFISEQSLMLLLYSDVNQIPHWGQPTHVMSLLKFIENGSIKMVRIAHPVHHSSSLTLPSLACLQLWISGTK